MNGAEEGIVKIEKVELDAVRQAVILIHEAPEGAHTVNVSQLAEIWQREVKAALDPLIKIDSPHQRPDAWRAGQRLKKAYDQVGVELDVASRRYLARRFGWDNQSRSRLEHELLRPTAHS